MAVCSDDDFDWLRIGAIAIALGLVGCAEVDAVASAPRVTRSDWPLGLELDHVTEVGFEVLSEDVVALGERLFFDANLSRDRSIRCASCHDIDHGLAAPESISPGVFGLQGTRNAPAISNRLMGRLHFWDGRSVSLEEQVLGPLFSEVEMGMDESTVLTRLAEGGYTDEFERAFGESPSVELVARAIAAFERTLLSGASPFDRFEWLGERQALTAAAQRGLELFRNKGRCTLCHTGTNFTDELFHNVGIHSAGDGGRAMISGAEEDHSAFKTPSLRNVGLTAPYMHDGSLATLEEVVDHYDQGGVDGSDVAGVEIIPLGLEDAEKRDLVEFLQSLTGPIRSVRPGALEERLAALR